MIVFVADRRFAGTSSVQDSMGASLDVVADAATTNCRVESGLDDAGGLPFLIDSPSELHASSRFTTDPSAAVRRNEHVAETQSAKHAKPNETSAVDAHAMPAGVPNIASSKSAIKEGGDLARMAAPTMTPGDANDAQLPKLVPFKSADSSATCCICGQAGGLVRCGAGKGFLDLCQAWMHPSCAFDTGCLLSSCASLGAELYFIMCAEHSVDSRSLQPSTLTHGKPSTSTSDCWGVDNQLAATGHNTDAIENPISTRRSSNDCLEGRASKLSRLARLAQANERACMTEALHIVEGDAAPDWWWTMRLDLVPPLCDAAAFDEGSVIQGKDSRGWRVSRGTMDGRVLWVPLGTDGSALHPSQLPPPALPSGRGSDRPACITDAEEAGHVYPRVRLVMSKNWKSAVDPTLVQPHSKKFTFAI